MTKQEHIIRMQSDLFQIIENIQRFQSMLADGQRQLAELRGQVDPEMNGQPEELEAERVAQD